MVMVYGEDSDGDEQNLRSVRKFCVFELAGCYIDRKVCSQTYKQQITSRRADMTESTLWWLLAGAAVGIELVTGTFYLLMLAIGLAAAAIASHMGLPLTWQLVTAAAVGGGAVVLWYYQRGGQAIKEPVQSNADVHIDIGEPVLVAAWNTDGTTSVTYRGANWTAMAHGADPQPGQHRIKELLGNRLVLEKI
jgi:membrane protein implicated in regulation of membrane protease activity